jgi:hypothetical protein
MRTDECEKFDERSARNFALNSIELFFSKKKFNLTDYFNDYFNRQKMQSASIFDSVIQVLNDWEDVSED